MVATKRAATGPAPLPSDGLNPRAVVGAVSLAESIRRYGRLAAEINPLGSRPMGDPALFRDPRRHAGGIEATAGLAPATAGARGR